MTQVSNQVWDQMTRKKQWYQDSVLDPLSDVVRNRYFKLPLDANYFGTEPLILDFRDTFYGFSLGFGAGMLDIVFCFQVLIHLPFTLPVVTDDSLRVDLEHFGRSYTSEIVWTVNNFSVFQVLRQYFGSCLEEPDVRKGINASWFSRVDGKKRVRLLPISSYARFSLDSDIFK